MKSKQITCKNGHYYNESYGSCPICSNGSGGKSTVLLDIESSNHKPKPSAPQGGEVSSKTIYMGHTRETDIKVERVVTEEKETPVAEEVILAGWLVIISENGKGSHYPVTFGFNSIGRGSENHITIANQDNSISREKHASVIYDYSNNIYFLKHEDGKFLTYLNGSVVLETKELKAFDKIKIGNTELLLVALCGENFKWDI